MCSCATCKAHGSARFKVIQFGNTTHEQKHLAIRREKPKRRVRTQTVSHSHSLPQSLSIILSQELTWWLSLYTHDARRRPRTHHNPILPGRNSLTLHSFMSTTQLYKHSPSTGTRFISNMKLLSSATHKEVVYPHIPLIGATCVQCSQSNTITYAVHQHQKAIIRRKGARLSVPRS